MPSARDLLWRHNGIRGAATTARADDYYPGFDYLRGILALGVVLGHEGVIPWLNSANFAVQVFFALSGWLIGGILLRLSPKDLPRFYFNRAIRIWIPYYIALALLLIASLLHHDAITTKWAEFVIYMASFVYNIFGPPQLAEYRHDMPLDGTGNHFWSVNAEEQFYLVAPLLLVIAAPKFGRSVLTWVVIAILAFAYTAYKSDVDGLASIVFGVLAAVLARRYGAFHLEARSRVALVGCAAMTAVGIAKGINYATLAPICAVSIVLLFAVKGTQTRFGSIVGGMSYPLYLNHWIGVFIGHALLGPIGLRDSAMRVILSTVLGISIAVGHYWFIDRGMLALRRQMFSRERGLTAARVAYLLVFGGITFGITVAVHGQ